MFLFTQLSGFSELDVKVRPYKCRFSQLYDILVITGGVYLCTYLLSLYLYLSTSRVHLLILRPTTNGVTKLQNDNIFKIGKGFQRWLNFRLCCQLTVWIKYSGNNSSSCLKSNWFILLRQQNQQYSCAVMNSECSICFELVRSSETQKPSVTRCGHLFHENCIKSCLHQGVG